MAPIYVDLQAWDAASLPAMAFLSMFILCVLAITLLALCTTCHRQSFTLKNSGTVERNSSTLVRVKPADVTDNRAPERNITVLPEDRQLGPNQLLPWRSHTLERDSQMTGNGGMVAYVR